MIGNCVMVLVVSVVVEVAGHLVVTDPVNSRVALVLVWVPPVWSLLVVARIPPVWSLLAVALMLEAAGCVGAGAVGPSSSEDDEEVEGEEEDGRRLRGAGARSASGSSRLTILAIGGVGAGRLAVAV